jgi:glycosyltransferase involved in cell wall biosynthesis
MKIAIATWFPRNSDSPCGGVEAVSVNLTRALARIAGTEIHVVTFDRDLKAVEVVMWERATIHRLPQPVGSLLRFARGEGRRRLQEYLKELNPDVVHAHDTYGLMTRGLALPRVFTIHGFIHEDTRLKGGWRNMLRAAMWKRVELATWSEQPHIISISPYVRERLRGIARGFIHDIENPVDPVCFETPREEEPGRILCAAVICRRKNQQALVDAVAQLGPGSGVTLCLAGPVGEEDYAERLKQSIARQGITHQVHFLGNLSGDALRNELSKASAFALCSFEEGAPMGIAEAMAAGLPVVTSNRCGMPYMVRNGETGFLVDPLQSDRIRNRLAELISDSRIRRAMGRNARVFAESSFHPARVAERTLRVYQMLPSTPTRTVRSLALYAPTP